MRRFLTIITAFAAVALLCTACEQVEDSGENLRDYIDDNIGVSVTLINCEPTRDWPDISSMFDENKKTYFRVLSKNREQGVSMEFYFPQKVVSELRLHANTWRKNPNEPPTAYRYNILSVKIYITDNIEPIEYQLSEMSASSEDYKISINNSIEKFVLTSEATDWAYLQIRDVTPVFKETSPSSAFIHATDGNKYNLACVAEYTPLVHVDGFSISEKDPTAEDLTTAPAITTWYPQQDQNLFLVPEKSVIASPLRIVLKAPNEDWLSERLKNYCDKYSITAKENGAVVAAVAYYSKT